MNLSTSGQVPSGRHWRIGEPREKDSVFVRVVVVAVLVKVGGLLVSVVVAG